MTSSKVTHWRSVYGAASSAVLALVSMCCAACGLHAYPGSIAGGGGGRTTVFVGESGGRAQRVTETGGGHGGDSAGQTVASGGQSGNGGQASGNGGQSNGGQSTGTATAGGSGGRTPESSGGTSSGGQTMASGGAGGNSNGSTSGAGVTINGKFVPKEKAVVFIHIGHSNMRGMAITPVSLKPYFYNTEDGLWSYRGSFALAKEPTAPEGTLTYAGPGMAILHSARAAVAAGSDVQFVSLGYGVGSKTSVDYLKSGIYYPVFMGWASKLKGNVTFGAIVVMLGITERHLAADKIPGFPSRMAQIISDMRTDLGEPDLPVLFCDYEQGATGDLAPTGSVGSVIQPLVRQLPGMISKLVLVPTDSLDMQDDHHFTMQGHKDWSARMIQLMQSNDWFPWK